MSGSVAAEEKIEFNRDVLPILSNHCYVCHGSDSATREAGLRLDQRESAIGKAESGKTAIAPGKVEASELIRRITTKDESERMLAEGGDTIDKRIAYGFRLVTSRNSGDTEMSVFRKAYESELKYYTKDERAAIRLLKVVDSH